METKKTEEIAPRAWLAVVLLYNQILGLHLFWKDWGLHRGEEPAGTKFGCETEEIHEKKFDEEEQ